MLLSRFCLSLSFNDLTNLSRYRYLNLSHLELAEFPVCSDWCFSSVWGQVCQYFLKYSIPSSFSLFSHISPAGTPTMHVLIRLITSTGLWDSDHFSSFFYFLFLRLDNLNWACFSSAGSFFCYLISALELPTEFFISVIVLLNSKVTIQIFII